MLRMLTSTQPRNEKHVDRCGETSVKRLQNMSLHVSLVSVGSLKTFCVWSEL
jgi:hypothetical protein